MDALLSPAVGGIDETLSGKRVALVGLEAAFEKGLIEALEKRSVFFRSLPFSGATRQAIKRGYDLLIVQLPAGPVDPDWFAWDYSSGAFSVLLSGAPDVLVQHMSLIQQSHLDFFPDSCPPQEVLMRMYGTLLKTATPPPPERPGRKADPLILIADDEPTIRGLVRTMLTNAGLRCETAVDGVESLNKAREMRPDVLLLDVNMPGMDGFQVLATLRADDRNGSMRILLLTGREQEVDVLRGFSLGADDYVVKPFNPLELIARLKRLVS